MPIWPWATDCGLEGLAAMFELDCCICTAPGIGDDMLCGVPCRTTGEDTGAWETWANRAWAGIPFGSPLDTFCPTAPFGTFWA